MFYLIGYILFNDCWRCFLFSSIILTPLVASSSLTLFHLIGVFHFIFRENVLCHVVAVLLDWLVVVAVTVIVVALLVVIVDVLQTATTATPTVTITRAHSSVDQ
ncbi:unnamed protein product [Ceratitis capitata]|uniref:(Mediterranean fruit fly) hypothetical protein n=1 Tax=Ceratitis capitata TaxID=7213 RepID=A0A811V5T3_CERCA|nr:unnamed protein product [Ceratitis capitata]